MPVDNVVSVRLVTANGELLDVSENQNSDLFWAIRGAGPNFGIVTSAVMKTHSLDSLNIWTGMLVFSPDKLEAYIEAMNNLNLTEKMVNNWSLAHFPQPVIVAGLTYQSDNVEEALQAWKPLFDLGPVQNQTGLVEYAHMNDAVDDFCQDGGRKPTWQVGLETLHYPTWQKIFDEYVDFVAETNQTNSRILVETYSNYALREIGSEGASYPHRDVNFHAFVQPIYEDPALDQQADAFGAHVRSLWQSTGGFDPPRT